MRLDVGGGNRALLSPGGCFVTPGDAICVNFQCIRSFSGVVHDFHESGEWEERVGGVWRTPYRYINTSPETFQAFSSHGSFEI